MDCKLLGHFKESQGVGYFLTGSRVFGLEKDTSDLDVVIDIKDSQTVFKMLEQLDLMESIVYSDYNNGITIRNFEAAPFPVNIIRLHPREKPHWEYATKWLKGMLEKDSKLKKKLKVDKELRYALFENLTSLSRLINTL